MSEETTRDMPDAGSFEDRVFAELAAMRIDFTARFDGLEARSTTLEDKVDARLHETRPIWEAMQARLTEIGSTLEEMNSSMSLLVSDLFKTRARVAKLEERRPA